MIGQQLYTRERKGLFRASEGYDSVAKSLNLTDAFVKEFIHPYCVYNPSRKLQSENALPEDYPQAFTFVRYPDGRALVGRAVFAAADFTGQRSTFFAHNYVLPPGRGFKPGILKRVRFMSGYDIANGTELPGLEELPEYESSEEPGAPRDKTFADLGVSAAQFAKLASFIFQSAAGTKKVFLQVPVEPSLTSRYAVDLLAALWDCLPPFIVNGLGFLTYAREPENKKGLNIVFLEKNSVRRGDPRTTRDFFMDLSQPTDAEESAYASFLWDNAGNAEEIASFYGFASAFKNEFATAYWDDLTEIYKTLRESGFDNEDATALRDEAGIYRAVTRAFSNKARSQPETRASLAALTRRADAGLFSEYINFLINDCKTPELFLCYAEDCVNNASSPAALFAELRFWLHNVPAAFKLPPFIRIARVKEGALIDGASNPINTAKVLYGCIDELFGASPVPENYQKKISAALSNSVGEHLTARLDYKNLTRAQLAALPSAYIDRGKTARNPAPFLVLEILKKVANLFDAGAEIHLRQIISSYKLPGDARAFLVEKLKEFYADYTREPYFKDLPELMAGAELLPFVNDNASAAARAEFLIWALGAGAVKLSDPGHVEAVKAFIGLNIKDGAFKERIYVNPALKELARGLRFGKLAGIFR